MTDLAFLGIADAADLIRTRKLSPVEYAQSLLDRIGNAEEREVRHGRRPADAVRRNVSAISSL